MLITRVFQPQHVRNASVTVEALSVLRATIARDGEERLRHARILQLHNEKKKQKYRILEPSPTPYPPLPDHFTLICSLAILSADFNLTPGGEEEEEPSSAPSFKQVGIFPLSDSTTVKSKVGLEDFQLASKVPHPLHACSSSVTEQLRIRDAYSRVRIPGQLNNSWNMAAREERRVEDLTAAAATRIRKVRVVVPLVLPVHMLVAKADNTILTDRRRHETENACEKKWHVHGAAVAVQPVCVLPGRAVDRTRLGCARSATAFIMGSSGWDPSRDGWSKLTFRSHTDPYRTMTVTLQHASLVARGHMTIGLSLLHPLLTCYRGKNIQFEPSHRTKIKPSVLLMTGPSGYRLPDRWTSPHCKLLGDLRFSMTFVNTQLGKKVIATEGAKKVMRGVEGKKDLSSCDRNAHGVSVLWNGRRPHSVAPERGVPR
ncbi:hypothetical protein BC835DRAFT_1307145 [Cytidiella melzeri]|nr:hypothetical protein BC835DRAFT_1307145 [Cytidiella melzeri]